MVRGRDACWEHCLLLDATRQKVRCNYCQREFSGGVYRMKFHLAQVKNKDVVPCTLVPQDVQDHIRSLVTMPKKQKAPKKHKVEDQAVYAHQQSSSASDGVPPNHGSSGLNGSTIDDAEKQKQDDADKKIAKFLFHNSISFSAAKSVYYQEMLNAVAECGVGYKGPNYDKLHSALLEKVKGDVNDICKKLRDEWKETGCTILCDGWSDGRTKSVLVSSAACSKGTLFLKSVDVSGHADDAHYLYEVLASVVSEVGVDDVVQVVTNSSASFVSAGRLLMTTYPSLFWSPCASHCINKMLEDLGKQEWVSLVMVEADTAARYIYSNSWTLSMMRKFTGGRELMRPKISRFVANFLLLRSIVIQEDKLKHIFSHSDWLSSIYSKHPDAQAIKSLLFCERFWKSAREAVSISEPLVKILRIVDGDMPAMGYLHEGMERAKIAIKVYYKGTEEKYVPIWDIIDRRWNMQLHSPLHSAAAFLNPSIFYNLNLKIDSSIKNGFQEAMLKIASDDKDKCGITKEHPVYINAHGALGTDFAIMGRTLNAPGDWWMSYGYEVPTLQRAALRILCQPCSSHWCRWNWSTFENIHLKKRNKEEVEKLCELVFVHCNLWLQATFRSRDWKCRPIVLDDIDVGHEWPTESESSAPLVDDSWLDSMPFESRGSP